MSNSNVIRVNKKNQELMDNYISAGHLDALKECGYDIDYNDVISHVFHMLDYYKKETEKLREDLIYKRKKVGD